MMWNKYSKKKEKKEKKKKMKKKKKKYVQSIPRIDPSRGTHWAISRSTTCVTKAVIYTVLSMSMGCCI